MSKVSLNFNGEIRSKSDICFIVWLQGGSEIANDLFSHRTMWFRMHYLWKSDKKISYKLSFGLKNANKL